VPSSRRPNRNCNGRCADTQLGAFLQRRSCVSGIGPWSEESVLKNALWQIFAVGPTQIARSSLVSAKIGKFRRFREAQECAEYSRHYKSCASSNKDSSSRLASTQRKEVIRCLMVQQGGRRGVFLRPKS
jgi:hypothetical protein